MRRKCWGREKNLGQGSLVENKASEWKVWARWTASLVLSGWPKTGGRKPSEPFWPTVLLRQKKGENTQINH